MNATSVPLGEGTLCVGSPFIRLPVVQTDVLGSASYVLDLTDPLFPSAEITPGTTWNFQFWYRDVAGGPAGFNLSDAVGVQFCE
ncbi:MAG: hypothetical protein GY711_19210 [bacterium]|nr:hypothetical protein [bacterium]